jgi:hypothetical protein
VAVTEKQLQEAAKEWSDSLGQYKAARSKFYDLVVEAQADGWSEEQIWRAQMYASRDDIRRILRTHRRSTT